MKSGTKQAAERNSALQKVPYPKAGDFVGVQERGDFMASWKKLDKELQHQLCGMARFGQSKHEAKQEAKEAYQKEHGDLKGWNPCKVEGIYGIQTMETYRAAMTDFAKYAADKGIHHMREVSRNDAIQYLRDRQAEGKSAWTTTRDMSAINKVFGYDLTKKEVGLRERRDEDVKRSREVCAHDKYVDTEKYKDQMDFARACGCRRQSVDEVRYGDLQWKNGRVVAVKLTEKGGKTRIAPILNEYKDRITEIAKAVEERHDDMMDGDIRAEKLFTQNYSKQIDNHALRAEYAANLFHQLEQERAEGKPLCEGDFNVERLCNLRGRDISDDPQYKGHDRDICGMVSGALGHNRLEVVFSSYSYKM